MSGTPLKLFLDEHIWPGLTEALHTRGQDALHVVAAGRLGLADDLQFEFAAQHHRALLTYNIKHFSPLAAHWYETGRDHAGLILSAELARGELLRRVENLLTSISAEDMQNAVRYLGEFK